MCGSLSHLLVTPSVGVGGYDLRMHNGREERNCEDCAVQHTAIKEIWRTLSEMFTKSDKHSTLKSSLESMLELA